MSELPENHNVIRYCTSYVEHDYLYIVMEYAAKGDMYQVSSFSYNMSNFDRIHWLLIYRYLKNSVVAKSI